MPSRMMKRSSVSVRSPEGLSSLRYTFMVSALPKHTVIEMRRENTESINGRRPARRRVEASTGYIAAVETQQRDDVGVAGCRGQYMGGGHWDGGYWPLV